MGFIVKIIALTLAALWLPVTLHCDWEAAGLLAAHDTSHANSDCCDTANAEPAPCADDGCELVETGLYRSSGRLLQVAAPSVTACTWFLCLQLARLSGITEPVTPVTASGNPAGWVPMWNFERRAAPLSRAPSVLA